MLILFSATDQASVDAADRVLKVQRWTVDKESLSCAATSSVLAYNVDEASSLAASPNGHWVAVTFNVSGVGGQCDWRAPSLERMRAQPRPCWVFFSLDLVFSMFSELTPLCRAAELCWRLVRSNAPHFLSRQQTMALMVSVVVWVKSSLVFLSWCRLSFCTPANICI